MDAGDKVGILSANDATAFACVFGIARRGAVWCPINPRNEAEENRQLLELFDCTCLLYQARFAQLVRAIAPQLPELAVLVCLDADAPDAPSLERWLAEPAEDPGPGRRGAADRDTVMIVGTGGTTGRPKGVVLTDRNLETMTALTLMGYPFEGRPVYLALAPLTHAAGVLCFPVMALGGRVVVMAQPDVGEFLALIARHRVTHTFLPPTLDLHAAGARGPRDDGPLVAAVLLVRGRPDVGRAAGGGHHGHRPGDGPALRPERGADDDRDDAAARSPQPGRHGRHAIACRRPDGRRRWSPSRSWTPTGRLLATGERGEIVVRSSLVMAGYYKDPAATAEASRHGWHHTGDIGFLDEDGFLFIVDRAKDMIITGGFNVYSAEVEQALMQHPAVRDCAVVGLPDEKWGERVTAVLQLQTDADASPAEIIAFVKARIGSVKAPKQVEVWPDLPRSKVGKVLKADVRTTLLQGAAG